MAFGDRKSERVDFEQGIRVYMMGIDGTWRRDCLMFDVSQSGARLSVEGSLMDWNWRNSFCFCHQRVLPIDVVGWSDG